MLTADFSRAAQRFLRRLPPKPHRQVMQKIAELEKDPHPPDARPLHGYPFLRVSQGEYRIIYKIAGDALEIYLIGKRNDDEVYRQLKRSD